MPTAKKTSSGMSRVRAYSHTDAEGKKHYRSFSAPTKQEAEQAAAKWSGSADRVERCDLTVADAIDGYIRAKTGVLSQSTLRGYVALKNRYYAPIASRKIRRLSSADVQTFVSDLAAQVSPKTVSNIYGLLTASVALYAPEISWRIKLPTKYECGSRSNS